MSLLDILITDYDECLMDAMDQLSLYRLSWTCIGFHLRIESYLRRTLTLHRLLGLFLDESEWDYFRLLQFQCGMIISGSAALRFLARDTHWKPSDLDIYVQHVYNAPIISWLISIGFNYVPSSRHPDLITTDMALDFDNNPEIVAPYKVDGAVLDFCRNDVKIQLITTHGTILETVLGFHTTGVMNIITFDKAYCLFPKMTLASRKSLLQSGLDPNHIQTAAVKYHQRGWKILYSMPGLSRPLSKTIRSQITEVKKDLRVYYSSPSHPKKIRVKIYLPSDPRCLFPEGIRRVGDKKCWTFTLPPLQVIVPISEVSLFEANSWMQLFDGLRRFVFKIETQTLKGEGLTYKYTSPSSAFSRDVDKDCGNLLWRRLGPRRDLDVLAAVISLLGDDAGQDYFDVIRAQTREGWST